MPTHPESIVDATASYEKRAAAFTRLDAEELAAKHVQMAGRCTLPFFRATYYRWAAKFRQVLPGEASAPLVLSVGDLHLENFGTWRDLDARPVYGVNDLDEVDLLPYSNDLIRLACSFRIAISDGAVSVAVKPRDACQSILEGYSQCLAAGGLPTVLSEHQGPLDRLLAKLTGDPDEFWRKLDKHNARLLAPVPDDAAAAIASSAPAGLAFTYSRRRGIGLGSLGRARYLAVAQLMGGRLVREAKARIPPATMLDQANGLSRSRELIERILKSNMRPHDSSNRIDDQWVVRRLAPDQIKFELEAIRSVNDLLYLAQVMGRETANIHLSGSQDCINVTADLKGRPPTWLNDASKQMALEVVNDWQQWRVHQSEEVRAVQ